MSEASTPFDPIELAANAEQIPYSVYRVQPAVGNMVLRMPPDKAALKFKSVVDWEIEQLPPAAPLPEHLSSKLPGLYEFVARTTGFTVDDLPRLGAASDPDHNGQYISTLHVAYISRYDREGLTPDEVCMLELFEEVSAVHELTHGAFDRRHLAHEVLVASAKPDKKDSDKIDVSWASGLTKTHSYRDAGQVRVGDKGNLFTEAWAENVAMQYAAGKGFLAQAADTFPYVYGASDGSKTRIDPEYVLQYKDLWAVCLPSLASNTIGLLDQCHAGRPLFESIKDMLHAETQVAAQREFITALNSIQPGLYPRLSSLDYTEKDFMTGLGIARELHARQTSLRAA